MTYVEIRGLGKLVETINRLQHRHQYGIHMGLKQAGAYLLREANKIVPVEFGPLRASGFVRADGFGADTVVWVGYTMWYAVIVHEVAHLAHGAVYNAKYAREIALGIRKSRGPNQQYKFLEKPLRQNRHILAAIVAASAVRRGASSVSYGP
jgi:hypothetical protein